LVGGTHIFLAVSSQEKGYQGNNYLSWRLRAAKITPFINDSPPPGKAIMVVQ